VGQKAQNLRHKKTPAFQGSGLIAHSPHLAETSAGIGTLLEKKSSGLPGFIGPYPSTSLDETMLLHIFSCASTFANQHKLLLLQLYATGGPLVNVEFRTYLVRYWWVIQLVELPTND
jgi:hypothetical protein